MEFNNTVVKKVSDTLVRAGSAFLPDKKDAYLRAISEETNEHAKWVMETILANAQAAEENHSPLCDDTGIPHLVLEIGSNRAADGLLLSSIDEGIRQGLAKLPGRPMAVKGNDYDRINQSQGLDEEPAALESAPILLRRIDEDALRLHILMFGGGPAIRGKTYRVFHKHSTEVVLGEIIDWAKESVKQLGCTPCTLGIGIGRSHYEAASMMLLALVDGNYSRQTEMEQTITKALNDSHVGPLGLGGSHSVLATFMKVGPQRASGVRIVCLRPCCCFEPRIATADL
ncbi:MAG: fumarate hydratase [Clostridia bacterium]|nr:fumarate hydratase [Clostridia bacterium]